jgi:hypothetical protein
MRKGVGRTMSIAYKCGNADRAKRMLEALAGQLERKHPSAAASLREGLDETLTVLRFGLPDGLMRTLATTNPIEFLASASQDDPQRHALGRHDGPALGRTCARRGFQDLPQAAWPSGHAEARRRSTGSRRATRSPVR